MSDIKRNLDDLIEQYNRLHNIATDVTETITHDEFVTGVHQKTVGFKVMVGEPITLVSGARRIIFATLVGLYLVAPFVIVPLWAYHESNWWLLVGIPLASFVAPFLAFAQRNGNSIGALLLLACTGSWVSAGIHNYFTFFCLCGLWGYMFFKMAESAQSAYAMQSLMESPELFRRAITDERIIVVRKRDA